MWGQVHRESTCYSAVLFNLHRLPLLSFEEVLKKRSKSEPYSTQHLFDISHLVSEQLKSLFISNS